MHTIRKPNYQETAEDLAGRQEAPIEDQEAPAFCSLRSPLAAESTELS